VNLVAIMREIEELTMIESPRVLGRRAQLAKPSEVRSVLKVDVGALTSIAPRIKELPTILDSLTTEQEYVVCKKDHFLNYIELK
jgi:prolyl-tRNA editing enzyme YbaK/EbsC (Cys-tRNA(Pro) deacylase)